MKHIWGFAGLCLLSLSADAVPVGSKGNWRRKWVIAMAGRRLTPAISAISLAMFAAGVQANITTAIQLSPDPARSGYPLRAEITVANNGDSTVDEVILEVPVPAEVVMQASTAGALGASYSGGILQWSLGSLGGGKSVRRLVRFNRVSELPDGSEITVNAVASYITNPLFPRLTATAQQHVIVDSGSPLALQVTMDRNPARPGEPLTYTLTYGNRGPGESTATSLDFPLPDRVTVTNSGGGTLAGDAVHWNLGTLAEGASGRQQVVVQLDDTVMSGTMLRPDDDATLSGTVAGTPRSARSGTVTQVLNAPGLGLTVEMSPHPLRYNERLRAAFTVSNQTDGLLNNVRLLMDHSINDAPMRHQHVTGPHDCVASCDDPVAWSLGNLAPGESSVVTVFPLVGNGASNAVNGQLIRFTTQVMANGGHESLIAGVAPVKSTEPLTLLVTDSTDPLPLGEALTYTLTYGNRGAEPASASVLRFPVPPGMQLLSASPGWALDGDVVQWNLGDLPAGHADRRQVQLEAVDLAAGDIVRVDAAQISATITGATHSALGQAATRVTAGPTLRLAADLNPDPVRIRERLHGAFTVSNATDTAMTNVVVDVERYFLDVSMEEVQGTGSPTLPYYHTGVIRWSLGALAPRAAKSVTLFPNAGNGNSGPVNGQLIPFTARATADDGPVAMVSRVVAPDDTGPLSLGIAESGNPTQAGMYIDYSLVFGNRGSTPATDAELTFPLPAGATVVSSSGGIVDEGVLTWNLGDVAPGQGGRRVLRLAMDGTVPAGALPLIDAAQLTATVAGASRNARATTSLRHQATAPLVVRLDVSPKTAQAGQALSLTARLTNRGSVGLADIVVDIVPPAEMSTEGLTIANGGACVPDGCIYGIRWTIAALAAGGSMSVTASSSVRTSPTPPNGRLMTGWAEARDGNGEMATASDAALVSAAVDSDSDGVADAFDNCQTLVNNVGAGGQCDSDGDGFGNHCDGDLNNNGFTNAFDTPLYRAQIGQPSVAPIYNAADINCNGFVNAFDTPLFRSLFGSPPGPSGLHP